MVDLTKKLIENIVEAGLVIFFPNTGIVINPEKFQFSQSTVDFAGFRISNNNVEPLPKYIDAIRQFPTPENITDIRRWFLSPKVPFEWDEELESAFTRSKNGIIEAIQGRSKDIRYHSQDMSTDRLVKKWHRIFLGSETLWV